MAGSASRGGGTEERTSQIQSSEEKCGLEGSQQQCCTAICHNLRRKRCHECSVANWNRQTLLAPVATTFRQVMCYDSCFALMIRIVFRVDLHCYGLKMLGREEAIRHYPT